MKVEVETPPEYVGDVIGELKPFVVLWLTVKKRTNSLLKSMQKFHFLRCSVMQQTYVSQTQGRASYSMEPLKYAEAPTSVAAAVIEARKK